MMPSTWIGNTGSEGRIVILSLNVLLLEGCGLPSWQLEIWI